MGKPETIPADPTAPLVSFSGLQYYAIDSR